MAAAKTIKIDVVSDFVCAWCYIGLLDIEKAISQAHANNLPVSFEIQYHPFILNSQLTCDKPIPKMEFFTKKLGAEKYAKIQEMIAARAKQEGLVFTNEGVVRQTMLPHRIVMKAYLVGGQTTQLTMLKRLFRAFFEQGEDIGDAAVVAAHAAAAGVFPDAASAQAWLEGSELDEQVRRVSADALRKGVTGVPFTIIAGKWAVSGCQQEDCYYKIFEKLATTDAPVLHPQTQIATAAAA